KGGPQTLMGDVAGYRAAFEKAVEYRDKWRKYWKSKGGDKPDRDIGLETLALVLDKKIPVQMHCYRGDQMATMIDVAKEFGFRITRAHAVSWMTRNPAYALGILKQTGTLEKGKMADVVLWDSDPLSVYAHAEKVFVDGALVYDRDNPKMSPRSDFEVGQQGNG